MGLNNVTINLLNGDTLAQITSTTTNTSGLYSFGNLSAGNYVVEFVARLVDFQSSKSRC